nr:alpha-amylase family glycosyl hydrolase [uncultured Lichenicoccus sp.]
MATPRHPILYQINTRVLLASISARYGRQAGFDNIPDEALRAVAELGFDWIWFLGVWQTGAVGRSISRSNAAWQDDYRQALPDLRPEDVSGSPYAISGYVADADFGGNAALERLRRRVNAAGMRLMLDFVPNHLAPDHPWVTDRPSLFVHGAAADLASRPQDWLRVESPRGTGSIVLAHGRDPYFPGWVDTVQLDYANPDTQAAMGDVLLDIAGRCDGLRCDMAMLLLPDVFRQTWPGIINGRAVPDFWQDSIPRLRAAHADFCLMAEVYWGRDREMIAHGFDFAYDKGLYDALVGGDGPRVRDLLADDPHWQAHLARFLENHDEPRAAATLPLPRHKAAAVLCFTAPGLRLFHQGQLEGARAHIPIHLNRGPVEEIDVAVHEFYLDLLSVLRDPVLRTGTYRSLAVDAAWEGNPSHRAFSAAFWSDATGPRLLGVVNYGDSRGQCRIRLAHAGLAGQLVSLSDRLGPEHYARDADAMAGEGLYLDLPGWGYNLFAIA